MTICWPLDPTFDLSRVIGHQRDAAHGGAALGGKIGALDVEILGQDDGIACFEPRAVTVQMLH